MEAHRTRGDKGLKEKALPHALLDANFLMIPHQHGVDVFSELERLLGSYVPMTAPQVVEELERIASSARGSDRVAARVALSLLDLKDVEVVEVEGRDGDEALLNLAERVPNPYLCTQDKALKRAALDAGIPVITMRQTTHLTVVGERG